MIPANTPAKTVDSAGAAFPRPPTNYRWAVVGMLWFLCFFNYADRQAIFSIFPVLAKQYHFSKTELGWIGAAFTWVYAFAAPFAGHTGDRYPRKWVILGGLYIWSLVTGLTAQCTKVWHFVLVRGAEGLGETFYMPASMAMISDYHGPSTRSRAIGLHQTSIYAGTIGGSALAGWMALKYGWWTPFWVLDDFVGDIGDAPDAAHQQLWISPHEVVSHWDFLETEVGEFGLIESALVI